MKENKIDSWIIYLMFFFISITLFCLFFWYEKHKIYYGESINEHIKILVKKEDLNNITTDLIISDKKCECFISNISLNYVLDNDYNMYYEVYYSCKEKIKNGYIVNIKMYLGKTTIFKSIKEKLWKG